MKPIHRTRQSDEPMGIVIANGLREEERPRFWAYVYGPAPEAQTETATTKAA